MTEASDIYPLIAEKYGLSVEQVRSSIIYFWRTGVKRNLEAMINPEIYINKLGAFKIKDWKLKYAIPSSYEISQRPDLHERSVEYFSTLNTRLISVNELIEKKKNKNKDFRELTKSNSRNISESETDMGRTPKQTD